MGSNKAFEMQHLCLSLLKEILMTLDLAHHRGSSADRKAADRLQRRYSTADCGLSGFTMLADAIHAPLSETAAFNIESLSWAFS
jgi:hypothetical protein